ncbi:MULTISPECIES: sulfatase-like hydrolase/transferase [Ruegeria]|uniref:Arylsulfatase n=1 Tax=Ruegeria atlantica TaxID=81569 RepID=A0A0P1F6J3_9RHOB|nr:MULTISPECIES: sulfatase-like hydrolase/transferase [Ruegeria]CUH48991.1 Arylsulfatase [Ruegeria atlantica]
MKPKIDSIRLGCTVAALALSIAGSTAAQQFDAPFYELEKENGATWVEEDKAIDTKLAELEARFGKKPNIIYILTDDIGYGELGVQGGGAARGMPTPNLDQLAYEGALLNGFYAEPSCTPTRVALMTGRHPVRTGLTDVIFPGNPVGLAPEEVTVAELLSDAGYATAMYGKWHLGDGEETLPHHQGFDEAFFGLYNAAPWAWNTPTERVMWNNYTDAPDFFFRAPLRGKLEGKKGEDSVEVGPLNAESYTKFEEETFERVMGFVEQNAEGDKPFFIYYASHLMSQFTSHPDWEGKSPMGTHNGDQMMEHDAYIGRLTDKLEELGIAENTLVVWMSDNGPMYDLFPESSYTALRGGKGDVLEGGVRVPAVAWWPGVIEELQTKAEMIHVTDMYTTAARVAGVMDAIPSDRIVDGIDQSSFLLNATPSRREYMFHYSGASLGAVRVGQFKRHIGSGHGGLPGKAFFDIFKDPREEHGVMVSMLWAWVPFDDIQRMHEAMIETFPHREPYYSEMDE